MGPPIVSIIWDRPGHPCYVYSSWKPKEVPENREPVSRAGWNILGKFSSVTKPNSKSPKGRCRFSERKSPRGEHPGILITGSALLCFCEASPHIRWHEDQSSKRCSLLRGVQLALDFSRHTKGRSGHCELLMEAVLSRGAVAIIVFVCLRTANTPVRNAVSSWKRLGPRAAWPTAG